jgi:hypothetical protein
MGKEVYPKMLSTRDQWYRFLEPTSPLERGLIEQAVQAEADRDECARARAALRAEALRTADRHFVEGEEVVDGAEGARGGAAAAGRDARDRRIGADRDADRYSAARAIGWPTRCHESRFCQPRGSSGKVLV